MAKPRVLIGALLAVAALAAAAWAIWLRGDGFDYEAAFEQIPEAGDGLSGPPLVRLAQFAGKPRAEAEQVLGAAQSCEPALDSERCNYANRIEVVYIDGKAAWITVQFAYGRYPFAAEALQLLDLPASDPQSGDEYQMQWNDIAGLRSLQLVGDENGARFARIKVSHE